MKNNDYISLKIKMIQVIELTMNKVKNVFKIGRLSIYGIRDRISSM